MRAINPPFPPTIYETYINLGTWCQCTEAMWTQLGEAAYYTANDAENYDWIFGLNAS